MKRPALYIGVPYILGLLIASKFDILSWGVILLTALGIVLYRRAVWKYVLVSTLSCLIACCSYWHHESMTIQRQTAFAGEKTSFTGQIISRTAYSSGYADYTLRGMIQDSVSADIELFTDEIDFDYGDMLTISGTPELIASSYLFDSANYSRAKNIFLCFDDAEILEVWPLEKETLRSVIYDWRERMSERILSHMSRDTGAMLIGLLFGDKSGMHHSLKTALYRAGIGHILAVSGLHLDFLALCAGWILEKCRTGRKLNFIVIAVLCSLFVICAGETVSVKRACIMILISRSAKIFFRQANQFNSLAIAMVILGLENPFVIHSPSFWLSCSGAFGIGSAAEFMTRKMKTKTILQRFLKDIVSGLWVFAAVLPVSALYFREVSLISPVSNLVLVPVCMISLLMGVLAICFGCTGIPAEYFLYFAERLNALVLKTSEFLAGLEWTHASADSEILLFVLYTGAVAVTAGQVICRSRKFTGIMTGVVLAAAVVSVNIENLYQSHDLKIALLGTEQHCLLAVRQGDEVLLIDMTGETHAADYASVYLEQTGVRHIEALYLCQPREKSIRRYSEYLAYLMPGELWLMKESEKKFNLPGCETHTANQRELLFHGAKINISEYQIRLEYAEKLFVCTNEKTWIFGTPDILTVYGASQNIQPECGLLFLLDENTCYLRDSHTYVHENNLEITISQNGTCRVRRLYGDSE